MVSVIQDEAAADYKNVEKIKITALIISGFKKTQAQVKNTVRVPVRAGRHYFLPHFASAGILRPRSRQRLVRAMDSFFVAVRRDCG